MTVLNRLQRAADEAVCFSPALQKDVLLANLMAAGLTSFTSDPHLKSMLADARKRFNATDDNYLPDGWNRSHMKHFHTSTGAF